VQSSTDLKSWLPVQTITNNATLTSFTNTVSGGGKTFYRIAVP